MSTRSRVEFRPFRSLVHNPVRAFGAWRWYSTDPDASDLVAAISGVIELNPDDVPTPAGEDVEDSDVHYVVWYGLNCEEFSACFDTYGEAMDFAAGLLR